MDDAQLLRYSRHILLPEIDVAGQERLLQSSVLVVGVGGLGSPAAMYLAATGVGRLILADFDRVELSNLQRQIIHSSNDIDRLKTESAHERLTALNPDVRVETIETRLTDSQLKSTCGAVDVVIDGSDNFATRFAVNAACVETKTALVSGAALRFEGQVSTFDLRRKDSPCYRCLYAEVDLPEDRCGDAGVIAPLLGIIGSIQALEAIKLITATGVPLIGRVLVIDARTMQWQSLRLRRDRECPQCGSRDQA